jgi:hypothetical protein
MNWFGCGRKTHRRVNPVFYNTDFILVVWDSLQAETLNTAPVMFHINETGRHYHEFFPTDRTCDLKRNNVGSHSSSTRFESRQGPSIFSENILSTLFAINRDNAVDIATGYVLDAKRSKFESRRGKNVSSSRRPDRFWGPPSLQSNGYRGLFPPGVKRPGHETGHSPPTSAEVKNTWIYTSTPPCVFLE